MGHVCNNRRLAGGVSTRAILARVPVERGRRRAAEVSGSQRYSKAPSHGARWCVLRRSPWALCSSLPHLLLPPPLKAAHFSCPARRCRLRTAAYSSTAQASLFDIGSHFQNRLGALSSSRTAASRGNNPQGGGADLAVDPVTYERYRTWFEGYGINTTTDPQGSFLGDRRKMYGGLAGAGVTMTPGVTFGLSVDRNTTDADLPGASGRIDMTQVGAHRRVRERPVDARRHGHSRLRRRNSSRFDSGGTSTAAYHARLWGAMAELSYYVALPNNWRFVPQAHLRLAPLQQPTPSSRPAAPIPISGSAVTATRIRMLAGGEIGHTCSQTLARRPPDLRLRGLRAAGRQSRAEHRRSHHQRHNRHHHPAARRRRPRKHARRRCGRDVLGQGFAGRAPLRGL